MTGFNGVWLLVGLLVGMTAGIACMVALFALGSAGRGRRERRRIHRTALGAWRDLLPILPGWLPTAEQLDALDAEPPAVVMAYRAIAQGWARNDARWDVLLGVLTYTRREALRYRVEQLRAVAQ